MTTDISSSIKEGEKAGEGNISIAIYSAVLLFQLTNMEDIEKSKAELLAAGLSQQAVDGVMKLSVAAHAKADKNDKGAGVVLALKLLGEINEFMKTQSEADQAIYQEILKKKVQGK